MKIHIVPVIMAGVALLLFPNFIIMKDISTDFSKIDFDAKKYAIHDKPISFTKYRKDLTLKYIRQHYNALAEEITIVPKFVVIHWTECGSVKDAFSYFNRETLQPDRSDIRHGGSVNVSAHFIVDRDGTIYRLMPETVMARHVIGLNHCSIGIENVGGPASPMTQEQLESNAWLIVYLARQYPTIEHVIGHHEYLKFKKNSLWSERDPRYTAHRKIDPGETFMKLLKKQLEKNRST